MSSEDYQSGGPNRYGAREDDSWTSKASSHPNSHSGSFESNTEAGHPGPSQASSARPDSSSAFQHVSPATQQRSRLQQLSVLLPEDEGEAQGLMQGDTSFVLESAGTGRQARRSQTPAAGGRTPNSRRRHRSSSDSSQDGAETHRGARTTISGATVQTGRILRTAGQAAGNAAQKVVTFAGKAGRLLSPSPARARHPGFDRIGGRNGKSTSEIEPAYSGSVSPAKRRGSKMEPQLDSEWDWEAALKNHPSKRRHAGSLPPIFSASTENAANLYHSRAAVRGSPSPERKLQPFHIPRELEQRLESLGAEMPIFHKVVLWFGIIMDFVTKISLIIQLAHFAQQRAWVWFGLCLAFFVVSSSIVTAYWLTHYPGAMAETAVTRGKPYLGEKRVLGLSKKTQRVLIRQLGTLCAMFQFGTAFAALRALRSSPDRQRLVAMDLRGMRLADSCFLTLGVNILQIYVGIRCGRPDIFCRHHHKGFDAWLCLGIVASLVGATLSYFSMEMNDLRARTDPYHVLQLTSFLIYRLLEIAARTTLLALFANILGTWVFCILGAHALAVLILLAWSPKREARVSKKQQQQAGPGEVALQQLSSVQGVAAVPAEAASNAPCGAFPHADEHGLGPMHIPDGESSSMLQQSLPSPRSASAQAKPATLSTPFASAAAFGSFEAVSPRAEGPSRVAFKMCLASPVSHAGKSASAELQSDIVAPFNDSIRACHSPNPFSPGAQGHSRRLTFPQQIPEQLGPKPAAFLQRTNPTYGTSESRNELPSELLEQLSGFQDVPLSPIQQQPGADRFPPRPLSGSKSMQPQHLQHVTGGPAMRQNADHMGDKENQGAVQAGLRARGPRGIAEQPSIRRLPEGTPSKDPLTKPGGPRQAPCILPSVRSTLPTIPSLPSMPERPNVLHRRGRSMSRVGSCNDAGLPPLESIFPPEASPPKAGVGASIARANTSPLRMHGPADARRKADLPTPWQKVMALEWWPVRMLGCTCHLPFPRFSDVWLLFACMIWPPSAFASDATTRTGQFWWRERGVPRKSVADVALEGRLVPFPLYQLLVAGEAAAMLGLIYLHLHNHAWAVYYFQVVIILHLLWGLAGHIWLATQHMAARSYQEDDLDRAIRFKEVFTMQRANMLSPEKSLPGIGHLQGSPSLAQFPSVAPVASPDALTTIVVDRNSAVRHSSPAVSLRFSQVKEQARH